MRALDEGAIVEFREHGRSALRAAAEFCNLGNFLYLLDRGCDPNEVINHRKGTLLHWTAKTERQAILQALIEHGANIEARDGDLRTPLHIAAKSDAEGCIGALLKSGADIGAKDSLGDTPLHVAARRGCTRAVTKLLLLGTDVNNRNRLGETPWTLAHRNQLMETCATLVRYGADENCIRSKRELSPERLPGGQFLLPLRIDGERLTAANFASRVRSCKYGRGR